MGKDAVEETLLTPVANVGGGKDFDLLTYMDDTSVIATLGIEPTATFVDDAHLKLLDSNAEYADLLPPQPEPQTYNPLTQQQTTYYTIDTEPSHGTIFDGALLNEANLMNAGSPIGSSYVLTTEPTAEQRITCFAEENLEVVETTPLIIFNADQQERPTVEIEQGTPVVAFSPNSDGVLSPSSSVLSPAPSVLSLSSSVLSPSPSVLSPSSSVPSPAPSVLSLAPSVLRRSSSVLSSTPSVPSPSSSVPSPAPVTPIVLKGKALKRCGRREMPIVKAKEEPEPPKAKPSRRRRPRKPKKYEIAVELSDPTAEKKRLNAINAKKNREKKKDMLKDLGDKVKIVTGERDALQREVEELKKREQLLRDQLMSKFGVQLPMI